MATRRGRCIARPHTGHTHPPQTRTPHARRQTHTLCARQTGRLSPGVPSATTAPPSLVTYHPTRQQPLSASHNLSRPLPASRLDLAHEDGHARRQHHRPYGSRRRLKETATGAAATTRGWSHAAARPDRACRRSLRARRACAHTPALRLPAHSRLVRRRRSCGRAAQAARGEDIRKIADHVTLERALPRRGGGGGRRRGSVPRDGSRTIHHRLQVWVLACQGWAEIWPRYSRSGAEI